MYICQIYSILIYVYISPPVEIMYGHSIQVLLSRNVTMHSVFSKDLFGLGMFCFPSEGLRGICWFAFS